MPAYFLLKLLRNFKPRSQRGICHPAPRGCGCVIRLCAVLCSLISPGLLPLAQAQSTDDQHLVDSLVRIADSLSRLPPTAFSAPDSSFRIVPPKATDTIIHPTPFALKNGAGLYKITGIVQDKNTGEGIPFATVFFKGTEIGIPADVNGHFELDFAEPPGDSLLAQAMGYATAARKLDKTVRHAELEITLVRDATQMHEFVFHAGEDPALLLLKKIIRRKPVNNPDRLEHYSCEVYNKMEVDLQHLTKKQFMQLPVPMIRKFAFIYNNLDTISEKAPFLPLFLTESLSDYYYQRSPKKTKEIIRATQVKGIKTEQMDQYLGSMYQQVNAYDNFIPVFDKRFVSPISDAGIFYYKYRIRDTEEVYGQRIILVQFSPKRNGENCFYGDFWVADSPAALQRVTMEVPADANVNWISRATIYQEFAPLQGGQWCSVKNKFSADFVPPYNMKLPGFIGRRTTSYKNVSLDDTAVQTVLNSIVLKGDVTVADTARNVSEAFWEKARHDTLSHNERAIYSMLDTLETLPFYERFKHLMKFAFTGFYQVGALEFGPYYYLYSHDPVEGRRLRIGVNTTQKLWKDAYLRGYLAYGTKDETFKYYLSGMWLPERHPRTYLYASYKHDVDRGTNSTDAGYGLGTDNGFSTLFHKHGIPYKLAFVNDIRFEAFRENRNGFSAAVTAQHRSFSPYAPLPSAGIFQDADGNEVDRVVHTDVGLRLRYAYRERYIEGAYRRISTGSEYPIVELRYNEGLKNVLGGNYAYHKLQLHVSDQIKIPPLGKLYYHFYAGKIFGTLPYPLLEVHPGNEFYYYNPFAFNMMQRYEFISDQWAGFNIENHIGGGIFNYIPYLKKAKLRQFWTAKGIIGSLSDANRALNFDKNYDFRTLEKHPYVEVGTGVENIFQLLRIDFVWRVTPRPLPGEERRRYFGIFGSLNIDF